MVVGRLGSDPCCECDVEGNYGVDRLVAAAASTATKRCWPWLTSTGASSCGGCPSRHPRAMKAIGQRELGDAAEPEAPAEELATELPF